MLHNNSKRLPWLAASFCQPIVFLCELNSFHLAVDLDKCSNKLGVIRPSAFIVFSIILTRSMKTNRCPTTYRTIEENDWQVVTWS